VSLTDVVRAARVHPVPVRIEIRVRPARAPCGEVVVDGGAARPFSGWLQLLSILGEVLPRPGGDGRPAAGLDPTLGDRPG
jgi:hypothetical protein